MSQSIPSSLNLPVQAKSVFAALRSAVALGKVVQIITSDAGILANCGTYEDRQLNHADHYADDLEVDLEEIMLADFNTETQDDSPRDIAKELVALHNELITGSSSTLARLQHAAPAAVATSQRQTVGPSRAEPSCYRNGL